VGGLYFAFALAAGRPEDREDVPATARGLLEPIAQASSSKNEIENRQWRFVSF
jgi:hypothetical protein